MDAQPCGIGHDIYNFGDLQSGFPLRLSSSTQRLISISGDTRQLTRPHLWMPWDDELFLALKHFSEGGKRMELMMFGIMADENRSRLVNSWHPFIVSFKKKPSPHIIYSGSSYYILR